MLDRYPEFSNIVRRVFSKSSMQRKRLIKLFEEADEDYWGRAGNFSLVYLKYLADIGMHIDEAVDAYLLVCRDMLLEQVKFARTGEYSPESAEQCFEEVYADTEMMGYHLQGLLLSQFLWRNHYRIFDFYCREIANLSDDTRFCLDIGPGHGLFLVEAARSLPGADFAAINISGTALDMSRMIASHFVPEKEISFFKTSVFDYSNDQLFDFVTMGKVLEHVDSRDTARQNKRHVELTGFGFYFHLLQLPRDRSCVQF